MAGCNIYGELLRAQLERLSSDPTPGLSARLYWHTTELRPKVDDGTAVRGVVTDKGLVDNYVDFTEKASVSADPASGNRRLYFKNDGKLYKRDSGGVEAEVGGASAGGINYIENSDFESNITGWNSYADAAGTSPVDGTGETEDITIERSTTAPLRDVASLLLTKDASDRQGLGFSYDFTIDSADICRPLKIEFDYQVVSGTYATGDLGVFIYDIDNAVVIQPAPYQIDATSVFGRFTSYFQTNTSTGGANAKKYRLIVHVASTSASAYSLRFDNFKAGPEAITYGSPVTDWKAWTPTGSWATGANTNYSGMWRRVGDTMQIEVVVNVTGTPTSASLTINIPSGYTIDTAKLATTSYNALSSTVIIRRGASYIGAASYSTTTAVSITYMDDAAAGVALAGSVTQAAPDTFADGDYITMQFTVPIVGWGSSVVMSEDADTRVVAFGARLITVDQTVGTAVEDIVLNSVRFDTHGGFDITTGRYTFKVPGKYRITGGSYITMGGTAASVAYLYFQKNGAGAHLGKWSWNDLTNSKSYAATCSAIVDVNVGDYIVLRGESSGQTYAASFHATDDATFMYGERISGPTTVAASEKICAVYKLTSATGNTAFANSTHEVVDFDSKVVGTHGAVTVGASWKFTAPRAGNYRVSASCFWASTTNITDSILSVYKNGSLFSQLDRRGVAGVSGLCGSTIVPLLAGEYLDVRMYHTDSGAAARNINTNDNINTVTIESV